MGNRTPSATTPGLIKRADPLEGFAGAVNDMNVRQLKADALKDVGGLGLAALGVGAAGAGALGLYHVLKRNKDRKKLVPATLPMPYPVKAGSFLPSLAGNDASTKAGIPWYGPAMLATGLGGLALGWKGTDYLLGRRRKAEGQAELDKARKEFHDALLSQYDSPLAGAPPAKAASDDVMRKAGADLDALWDAVAPLLKRAIDWSNLSGQALGGYGVYAGLSGLLTGAVMYDQAQKRSRRAVLEKAMQRRDRRRFMQAPTEIQAVPEPTLDAG